MTKEPKKLKWGDRTAAVVDEAGYLIGIGLAGHTCIKDAIMADVPESPPDGDLNNTFEGDVFMEKPRFGAYRKYIKIKNIVHEEN